MSSNRFPLWGFADQAVFAAGLIGFWWLILPLALCSPEFRTSLRLAVELRLEGSP